MGFPFEMCDGESQADGNLRAVGGSGPVVHRGPVARVDARVGLDQRDAGCPPRISDRPPRVRPPPPMPTRLIAMEMGTATPATGSDWTGLASVLFAHTSGHRLGVVAQFPGGARRV